MRRFAALLLACSASCAGPAKSPGDLLFVSDGELAVVDLHSGRTRTLWSAPRGAWIRGLAKAGENEFVFTLLQSGEPPLLMHWNRDSALCRARAYGAMFAYCERTNLAMHYAVTGPDSGWLVAERGLEASTSAPRRICRPPRRIEGGVWLADVESPVDLGAAGLAYQGADHAVWILRDFDAEPQRLGYAAHVPLTRLDSRLVLLRQESGWAAPLLEVDVATRSVVRSWTITQGQGCVYSAEANEILYSTTEGFLNLSERAALWAIDRDSGSRRQLVDRCFMRSGIVLRDFVFE